MAGKAVSRSQSLSMAAVPKAKLSKLHVLAGKMLPLRHDEALAKQVVALRSMLQVEGQYIDKHMIKKIPKQIIASMKARLAEIAQTQAKMQADLAADEALYKEWETK